MKRFLAPLFALGVLLSACQPTAMDDGTGPIKIGLITPVTGDIGTLGNDILHGAELMVDAVNENGGVNGRMVEIILEDGKCSGTDAASAAQKLINVDNVDAIHGAGCSGESLAAAPIAESAKVLMISPSSSSPDLSSVGDFFFRTYPNDALKTVAMAQYFEKNGYAKIAMIGENTDFCTAFATHLKEAVGEENFVFDEVVEPGTKDYRTLMTRLKDTDFDIFVVNAQVPATGAAMMQQMRELGIEQPMIGHDIIDTSTVVDLAGEAAEGVMAINVPTISEEGEFRQMFIAAHGQPQSSMSWGAYGYDTMGVLLEAMAEVGTDGVALRDYLYDLAGYEGVVGTISFDDNGDVLGVQYVLKQVQDGELVIIDEVVVE